MAAIAPTAELGVDQVERVGHAERAIGEVLEGKHAQVGAARLLVLVGRGDAPLQCLLNQTDDARVPEIHQKSIGLVNVVGLDR